ncbi:MAG: hypothetical protein O7G85_00450 [Planctomycetota bacterium]|nr:hypothetical protein [Planctomycetota bacterium]
MPDHEPQEQFDYTKMLAQAGPYPLEAYSFVREGLSYTMQRVHENVDDLEDFERHVDGRQLCLGLRDFAIDQYGLLAPVVLSHWSIFRTDDFGRIVFAMINAGLMSRSTKDTLEDFRSVFDFGEAFSEDQLLQCVSSN